MNAAGPRHFRTRALAVLALAALGSCPALLDPPCQTDADCDVSDGYRCATDRVCRQGFTPDAGGDAGPPPPRCGDGVLSPDAGEACEDRNDADGDGCSASCQYEYPSTAAAEAEPNDDGAHATVLPAGNARGTGSAAPGADVDLWRFPVSAVVGVRVETLDPGSAACTAVDTVVRLLADDGTTVLAQDDNSGGGGCSRIDPASHVGARLLHPGAYLVEVRQQGSAAGPYELRITLTDRCGNGVHTAGEPCDDGNAADADGCEADCTLPACHNGIRDPGEFCYGGVVAQLASGKPQVSAAAADLDGDGILDVISAEYSQLSATTAPLNVFRGNGTDAPVYSHQVAVPAGPVAVVARDLDGDGITDLAVTSGWYNTLTLARGLPDGGYASGQLDVGFTTGALAVADVDGDGALDVVAAELGGARLRVARGNGMGSFNLMAEQVAVGGCRGVAVADLNADGAEDLVMTSTFDRNVTPMLGSPSGLLSPVAAYPLGLNPWSVGLGDVDGDTIPDAVVACGGDTDQTTAGVYILKGVGDGNFGGPSQHVISSVGPNGIALADFNNDGKLDIAVSAYVDANLYVFTLAEDLSLTILGRITVGSFAALLLAPDLNRDGVPDLVNARGTLPEIPFVQGAVAVVLSDP